MNNFIPTTGSESEWNAAYYRLEDYFRALRVVNKVHQNQIILRLLEAAARKHAADPDQSPTVLAMEEACAAMDRWFADILLDRERRDVAGLISFLAVEGPEKWPAAFLAEVAPDDFQRAMRECEVPSGPDLEVTSMVPQPPVIRPMFEAINLREWWRKLAKGSAPAASIAMAFALFTFLRLLNH